MMGGKEAKKESSLLFSEYTVVRRPFLQTRFFSRGEKERNAESRTFAVTVMICALSS